MQELGYAQEIEVPEHGDPYYVGGIEIQEERIATAISYRPPVW